MITVRFRIIEKLFNPIQVGFGGRTFFHVNIRSDISFLEPGQKLTVPIGRVGGNRRSTESGRLLSGATPGWIDTVLISAAADGDAGGNAVDV